MHLAIVLIVALVPSAIAPGLLSAFDITPKIAILLFGESVLLMFCKRVVNGSKALLESKAGKLFAALLVAQFVSTAISTAASSNPILSLDGSSWRHLGLLSDAALGIFAWIVAAWLAEDPARMRSLLRVASATGFLVSVYGITQYFGWDPLLPNKAYQSGEGSFMIVRPPGTLGHADYFADWLVMVTFCSFALAKLESDSRWLQSAARFAGIVAVFAIVLSGTRSALLGLVAGTIVFAAIAKPQVGRASLLLATACVCGLAVLYFSPAGARLRARVHWSIDDARGGARLLLWKDSIRMAADHPVLGSGPETFTQQFPRYASDELARAYPDFYQESPHNMFLDTLTSCGFFGLVAIAGMCALAAGLARGNAALAAAFAGAVVCQQFMVMTFPTALYFYLIIAMLVASAVHRTVRQQRSIPALAFATAAIIAAVFCGYAARLVIADRAMTLALESAEKGDVAEAANHYREVRRWQISAGDHDLDYSRTMERLATSTKNFETSVAAAQQATESAMRAAETAEDRQNAWYNLATIAALRNDRDGVEQDLRASIRCAPKWFKPHWTLSQFLELTGRHQEARGEASIAMELNGGRDSEVSVSCRRILDRP